MFSMDFGCTGRKYSKHNTYSSDLFVVLLSIVSLIMIFSGTRKNNLKSLGIWSLVCLFAMFAGAIGTNVFPKTVFGIFERMSTFSAVVFNTVLECYLFAGRFAYERKDGNGKGK